ncbi:MAG: hypothetical protein ACM3MD_01430 [Betaproteobacteria bacterium]
MIIKNGKTFNVGALFAITFMGVLITIFSPVFQGKNGLEFADQSFNKLAKGSSYFVPKVAKSVEPFVGKSFAAIITLDKAEDADSTVKLFSTAGATIEKNGTTLKVAGDLGVVLQSALKDADAMYHNNGKAVSERYGMEEKKALQSWWLALGKIEKNLKKEKKLAEAKIFSDVMKKGIEPGYNFYEIDANKVSEHAGMMSGLLVFYVFYTMWWGYAIFYLFDGFGLTMKKAKVKKEA